MSSIPEPIARDLIELGRQFAARGWVPATSGNLSARISAETVAITASGCHKGELDPDHLVIVDLEGRPHDPDRRASNEALLHTQLYRRDPAIGAVLHVHAVHATVLSRVERGALRLAGWELQKAFPGVTSAATLEIPIFPNLQDIAALAARVDRHGPMVGYLIEGHGLYAWGRTLADARRHVEALEFLCECELHLRRLGR